MWHVQSCHQCEFWTINVEMVPLQSGGESSSGSGKNKALGGMALHQYELLKGKISDKTSLCIWVYFMFDYFHVKFHEILYQKIIYSLVSVVKQYVCQILSKSIKQLNVIILQSRNVILSQRSVQSQFLTPMLQLLYVNHNSPFYLSIQNKPL